MRTNRTLAIDCATDACSAALFNDGSLVAGTMEMLGRGHAERLVQMIGELPDKGRSDLIAVSAGPGSFTGIRVGLAAARALALAWEAELVAFPTLSLVAAQARRAFGDRALCVCNHAGHGEWFVQKFGKDGAASGEVRSLAPDAAIALAGSDPVAGTKAEALVSRRGHGEALAVWPDARDFALLDPGLLLADARPAYGRAPDAKPARPRK